MKDYVSAVLLGAAVGAAATMYYFNHQNEAELAGKQIKAKTKDAINMAAHIGQDMNQTMRKRDR